MGKQGLREAVESDPHFRQRSAASVNRTSSPVQPQNGYVARNLRRGRRKSLQVANQRPANYKNRNLFLRTATKKTLGTQHPGASVLPGTKALGRNLPRLSGGLLLSMCKIVSKKVQRKHAVHD